MSKNKIESGVQLFSRVNSKTFLEGINPKFFPEGGPYPNQVIEITGGPKVDKNGLLIDFIVKCILPSKYNTEWKDSAAVFINTEYQINLLKIIKTIEILLEKHHITENKKIIIENALKNLILLNCYSLEELEITFYSLEKIIRNNENLSLVAIDNIAANFWISKFNINTLSYYQHSLKNFEILYNIINNQQILLIYIRHENTINKKRFTHKIDYRIDVESDSDNFKAIITNFEKQSDTCILFRIKAILEF